MTAVILLSESVRASIARDAVTFASVTGIIGVGVWCGSAAMQWAGFLLLAAAMGRLARVPRLTPQQAADRLWRDYGARAAECTETGFSGPLTGRTGAVGRVGADDATTRLVGLGRPL